VLGDGGECHIKRRSKFANAAGRLCQPRDHRPPRRVGKGMEYGIKLFALIVYHMVKYSPEQSYCQPFG
jgi:hypothetical protein